MQNDRLLKWIGLGEVFLFFLLAELILWGSHWFRPPILVLALIMIGICVGSNRYHRDSWEKIGLARKNLKPAFQQIMPLAILAFIPVLILAWGKKAQMGWDVWFAILGYPVWGLAQEYALMGFMANRLDDFFQNKGVVIFLVGLIFGIVHLPNPVLTPLTLVAGWIFTFFFLRRRQLIPLALVHALFGVGLSFALSEHPEMMSVGQAYLSRIP